MTDARSARGGGFSLVELLIALVVLAVGLLALGSALGYVSRQVRAADLRTERTVAREHAIERVRAIGFDDLSDRAQADAWEIGSYSVWWTTQSENRFLTVVELYTEGPAYRSGEGRVENVRDTTSFTVVK